jgi:lysyl-tRNA synthetase class 2
VSDPFAVRREKLAELRARGFSPYGGRFARTALAGDVRAGFDRYEGRSVRLAGRLMAMRGHGGSAFADLEDPSGRIQLQLARDGLGERLYDGLVALLDLGDLVGVEGEVFRTRRGEVTVRARDLALLAKALRPLPDKRHGLRDPDLRHRRRYLDLIANPGVRRMAEVRARLTALTRAFLDAEGFLEVETPVLLPLAGGATARPFRTHHHAMDLDLDLRIALELPLKRLLVGGLERVYEIGRVFRNEGVDTRHNPEFTMLEAYLAYGDRGDMMDLVERLLEALCRDLVGGTALTYQGTRLDFSRPWPRVSALEALRQRTGVDWLGLADGDAPAREAAARAGIEVAPDASRAHILDRLLSEKVEPELVQPTFLVDQPVEISPLAKPSPRDPRLADRFEAFVFGRELVNAFSELNDPIEQRRRMVAQVDRMRGRAGADEVPPPDEDFLFALEHGMPPAGGLGMGMDRLTMLFTDAASLREVILFPLVRPLPGGEGDPRPSDGGGK